MFSKTRVTENRPSQPAEPAPAPLPERSEAPTPQAQPPQPSSRPRSTPSVLSADLSVTGNIGTEGDIQIEGNVEGDVRAHQLVIGESATIKGEIVGDEVVVHGRVVGRVRGLKVRLTATARVEGDIIHKTIAIESGAHFEGSVQRQDDPLAGGATKKLAPPTGA
ncbi:protein CcmA, bactofilin family [Paracoccus alcaliphilus]|uniref:Protein CcmA, bactofilin family n=1 Tax=Paracoccus alcaliphilus TaxID=34002 RepID=A0A1H8JP47_9RHOB|nr:polymer-forming cytoskeletal protein [Paracoccus alcaliphilus]WCR19482.1 polymer-forming cytoskeletal protein [Paracoccus alcaliphilus]SEN82127.1 protein CcmA, bactofilin family [Paracoccus alcaliphilus]